ncbi:hypothetical protein PsYK624_061080 [Phanerochaete sordida]|uniref:Uncharacterized protein n=1 Tax=Phanerochaete sordida TaxID=48140 RepID=A0A9P3G9S7_9APHY|nr:hypothetical protein PsYK624_061080 [Phanerochaete sordida]
MSGEDKSERQLVQDIKDQIARARRAQVRTSAVVAQQKDTLKRLIEIVHSPYSSLKTISAQNIKFFIKEFPELEDDAINAVYDLCEDQDQKVRKEGYRAITSVSKEQRKWVKRNADVLVQLLQSDEPEEVEVVEAQLTEHLDMDPTVTLGVLCDQVAPQDEAADDEEQAIRDRLRGLVLSFMTGKAKRAITERHANTFDTPAETVLVQGMFKAITKLPPPDVEIVVKEILLPLPSFSPSNAPRGSELLNVLLDEAKAAWKSEQPRDDDRHSIPRTRFFLTMAHEIVVERRIAAPLNLTRFYIATFGPRTVLQNLTEDAQAFVIRHVAESFSLMQDTGRNDYISIRNQLVEANSTLMASFAELRPDMKHWPACVTLLRACKQRQDTSKWKPAHTLVVACQQLQEASNQQLSEEHVQAAEEVQRLIRSLLQTAPASRQTSVAAGAPHSGPSANVAKGASANGKPNGGRVQIKRKAESPAEQQHVLHHQLPSRPPSQASMSYRPQSPAQGSGRQLPPHLSGRQNDRPRTPGGAPSGRATPVGDAEPPPPTRRPKALAAEPSVPSLLSRMALGGEKTRASPPSTIPAKRRAEPEQDQRAPYQQQQLRQEPGQRQERARAAQPDAHAPPPGGWSIKGAARKQPSPPAQDASSGSLLERLAQSDAGSGGRRKRAKT